ncbi:MAG: sulfatase-like hydrolase/transferase [bacterium]|nr:sulfatase-like hydrolase/transferase [bacterium]
MTTLDRRVFLSTLMTAASLRGLAQTPPEEPTDADRANVVLIMADDLGYGDLGCYGCEDIRTPNIDRLASEGARMTDYYASAPVCSPTRCALLTGRYQARVPNLEWALYAGVKNVGLPPEDVTIATMMREAGIATAMAGKWHLGDRPEWGPNQHGFDDYFGIHGGNADYFKHVISDGSPDLYENETPVEREGYLTDLITERAVKSIHQHANRRFFLYVAYNAPHWPMQGPGDEKKDISGRWIERDRETYAAMVERMDDGVGRILAALREEGLDDNTFVVFCSDNGGDRSSRNAPLRGGKTTLWEGGIRVPCIARWPGVIPAGSVNRQCAITMDLSATLLSAALVRPTRKLDGMDLFPYLMGARNPVEQTLVWRNGMLDQKAVRWGKWKWLKDKEDEYLFNLADDIGEQENRMHRNYDIAVWLRGIYSQWENAMPYRQTLFGNDLYGVKSRDEGAIKPANE